MSAAGLFIVHDDGIVRGVHLWDLAGGLRAVKLLLDLPNSSPDSVTSVLAPSDP